MRQTDILRQREGDKERKSERKKGERQNET